LWIALLGSAELATILKMIEDPTQRRTAKLDLITLARTAAASALEDREPVEQKSKKLFLPD